MIKLGNLKSITNVITVFAKSHSSELLVGLGIAGMATSTVLAVRATPTASQKIKDAIDDENEILMDAAVRNKQDEYSPITRLRVTNTIRLCWRDYAAAAITGTASAICIIGGTRISLKRNAALVTAVKLSELTIKDLQEYKNKVVETIGVEKSDEIEEEIDKKHVESTSINLGGDIISGNGPILYFDKIGGQFFKSDKETIREAVNRLNHTMNDDMYVSLNDLYDELGLPHTVAGDELGWNREHGLIDIRFSSQLTPSGIPIVVVSTRLEPRTNYGCLH